MSEQSNLLKNPPLSVAPEDYVMNKAKIAEAKALISAYEEMNETGKQNHDELARELEQKIREGEQARMMLEKLKSQPTVQVPVSMPIPRPAIEYPSNTSRIEEVPNYDTGSGQSQQGQYHQFQGISSNQRTHNFVPQATVQTIGSSSNQQLSSQQWLSMNAVNNGQSQQTSHQLYSQYSQQNITPNSSSRAASYAPFGFPSTVRPQQQPTGQNQGKHDNYSRPMAPTQEQRRVASHQEPSYHGITGSNQGPRHTTSTSQVQMRQTMPAQPPGPSSHAAHATRLPQIVQQSSSAQKFYPEAAVSQNQAYPQQSSPQKATSIANQSSITVAASRPVAVGPQSNTSRSDVHISFPNSVQVTRPPNSVLGVVDSSVSPYPQTHVTSNQTTTHPPQLIVPTTLPSLRLDPTQYIEKFRELIRSWEAEVPPNTYFDHPSNSLTIFKDPMGITRIITHTEGRSSMWNGGFDQFCDHWLRRQNVGTTSGPSVTSTISKNSRSAPSSKQTSAVSMSMHAQGATSSNTSKAIPSTVPKAFASTVHKATPAKHDASSSKQTLPMSMHNQEAILLTPQISTTSSKFQTQLSTPSVIQLPPSTVQTPPSAAVPGTPNRQLSTIVNGVPRSVKQADKKSLASHILFGLGKRAREPDTSPTALAEPKPKRYAQQVTSQVGVGISPFTSSSVGQAPQAVQKSNVPLTPARASAVFSSLQQQPVFIPTPIPREAQQTSQESASASASSGDQQQLVNVTHEMPFISKVTTAALAEIPEASKTSSDQTSLSLQDTGIVQVALSDKEVPSVVQPDSQQETISEDCPVTSSGDSSAAQPQGVASVPLATSSDIVQTTTLTAGTSSDIAQTPTLTAPVAVSPLLSSGNITHPVASSTLTLFPATNANAEPRSSPVPSPLDSMTPTSIQMPQKNQPLFLPSPESSPGVDGNDDMIISEVQSANVDIPSLDLSKFSRAAKRKNRAYVAIVINNNISISGVRSANVASPSLKSSRAAKKNRAYVLAPRRPEYLVKYRQMEKRASVKRSRMAPKNSVSTSVAGEEDFYNAHENHSPTFGLDAYEQKAVQLACSRLQELSCKWDGCSAKMNSVDALIRHLNRQHKPSSTSHSKSFLCRWTQCGRLCNLREKHFDKHAFLRLTCPFEDCDESFRSAPPLWKHMRAEHEKGTLKPSAQPSYPKLKPTVDIPGVVPSYMITTRRVNPDSISSARHLVVGPRILRKIAGLDREKSKSKKIVRDSHGDIIPDEDVNDDYDFLTARPLRYSSNLSQPVDMKFEDLNSEYISKMADEGLVLWGREEEEEGGLPKTPREP